MIRCERGHSESIARHRHRDQHDRLHRRGDRGQQQQRQRAADEGDSLQRLANVTTLKPRRRITIGDPSREVAEDESRDPRDQRIMPKLASGTSRRFYRDRSGAIATKCRIRSCCKDARWRWPTPLSRAGSCPMEWRREWRVGPSGDDGREFLACDAGIAFSGVSEIRHSHTHTHTTPVAPAM